VLSLLNFVDKRTSAQRLSSDGLVRPLTNLTALGRGGKGNFKTMPPLFLLPSRRGAWTAESACDARHDEMLVSDVSSTRRHRTRGDIRCFLRFHSVLVLETCVESRGRLLLLTLRNNNRRLFLGSPLISSHGAAKCTYSARTKHHALRRTLIATNTVGGLGRCLGWSITNGWCEKEKNRALDYILIWWT
jgi:hypothetical protein